MYACRHYNDSYSSVEHSKLNLTVTHAHVLYCNLNYTALLIVRGYDSQ